MKSNPMYLIVFIVLFFGQAGMAQATDPADRSGVISKRDASVHVLTSGEIDSSKVEVGAYVEITYYKGEKLETVRGYIKAVDSETLTIGRGLWQEQIAFESIQKLIAAKSDRDIDSLRKGVDTRSMKKENRRGRITKKLFVGWATGTISALVADKFTRCRGDYVDYTCGEILCPDAYVGYAAGLVFGVSLMDTQDRFIYTALGSLMGFGAGFGLTKVEIASPIYHWILCPIALASLPLVGSTIMSEFSRKPPEASGFSVGLASDRRGGLFALATLRF